MLANSTLRKCTAAQCVLLSSELLRKTGQIGRPWPGRRQLRRLPTGPVEKWKPQIDVHIQRQTCVVQCKSTVHKRVTREPRGSNGKQLFGNQMTTRQMRGEVCRASQTLKDAAGDPRSSHASPTLDLSYLELRNVGYQPPGCETPILNDVNLSLDRHSLGLIFGRSGSGKTTLLQVKMFFGPTAGWSVSGVNGAGDPKVNVC
jgi:ABC-type multidrug transport system fused ATPase/permease subunit